MLSKKEKKERENCYIILVSLHFTCSKTFSFLGHKDFRKLWAHMSFLFDWLFFFFLQFPADLCKNAFPAYTEEKGQNVSQLCVELDDTSRCHSGQQDRVPLFLAVAQNGLWYSCSQPLSHISGLTRLNYDILCIACFTSRLWNKRAGRAAISPHSHSASMPNAYTVTPIN